jgi:hypothetical protein
MKLKAYIDHLESLYLKHGDLDVDTMTFSGRTSARPPTLSHRKILTGRERRPEFWSMGQDEERKGEQVVML